MLVLLPVMLQFPLFSAALLLAYSVVSNGEIVEVGPCNFVVSPESCNTSYLQFYLFTRNNPTDGEKVVLDCDWDNLTSSEFNSSLPNKIIIHGFDSNINQSGLQSIKNEYLIRGDYNVWMMDWHLLAKGPAYCYPAAMNNLGHASYCLANAVRKIKESSDNKRLHLIGFSLGGHVPAGAAKLLKPFIIPRITGLDPAMPGFVLLGRRDRLSKESAKFVDVYHTDALLQGLIEELGHTDIYMNGGITQPGCPAANITDLIYCDHFRATEYFAESINTDVGFYGWNCNNLFYLVKLCKRQGFSPVLVGEHISHKTRGAFVVETNPTMPYAQGPW